MRAARGSRECRRQFQKRAASVNPWADPDAVDPRETLPRSDLAAVNRQAHRIHEGDRVGSSRAAIARQLAERVGDGAGVLGAAVAVLEAEQARPGTVVPIGALDEISRSQVSVEGRLVETWTSSTAAIQQVGLLEDETGRTKLTVWTRSRQPWIDEGGRVRIREAAKNPYESRVSIALTGESQIHFPERDAGRR